MAFLIYDDSTTRRFSSTVVHPRNRSKWMLLWLFDDGLPDSILLLRTDLRWCIIVEINAVDVGGVIE